MKTSVNYPKRFSSALEQVENKNSSGDEIANANFMQYAWKVSEFTEIRQNNGHYAIQGHQLWYQL